MLNTDNVIVFFDCTSIIYKLISFENIIKVSCVLLYDFVVTEQGGSVGGRVEQTGQGSVAWIRRKNQPT